MRGKRARNEHFNCTEKWEKGHKCKGKLVLLSSDGESLTKFTDPNEDEEIFVDVVEEIRAEHTHNSYHSLQGQLSPRTLKLSTLIENTKVSILFDSGSTHNFL